MKKIYVIEGRCPIDDWNWVEPVAFSNKDRAELAIKELELDQIDDNGYHSGYYFSIKEVDLNECE